ASDLWRGHNDDDRRHDWPLFALAGRRPVLGRWGDPLRGGRRALQPLVEARSVLRRRRLAADRLGRAFLMAPTRKLLAAAAIGNTLIVLVWAMSRIWGVPVGPGAWEPEPVALADALATAFEVVIVGVSAVVLFRPAVAQRTLRPSLGLASIGVTGVA